MHKYLFAEKSSNVRLYCADGLALYEMYETCRKADDPVLDKDGVARDFFCAIGKGIFCNKDIVKTKKGGIRITDIADYFRGREINNNGRICFDQRILPLCYFLSTIWAFEFGEEGDACNDGNYRTRLSEALKWAIPERNLEFDRTPQYFSRGIELLFEMLSTQYCGRIYIPPKDIVYRKSHADGITLSHSIFRYGEIANLYCVFSEWGLRPNAVYELEYFERIADSYFSDEWKKGRDVCSETLVNAIARLYEAWDGDVPKKYKHYIKVSDRVVYATTSDVCQEPHCKAYWLLEQGQFNSFHIGICLDRIHNISSDIKVSDGENECLIPASTFNGVAYYKWMENGDRWIQIEGWGSLKSDNEITFSYDGGVLDKIISYNKWFDGHAVILLQSYIPPTGGNPVWRMMVGSQGVELWKGDSRSKNTEYALLSPIELVDDSVQCEGMDGLEKIGSLTVNNCTYYIYKLRGNLTSELVVGGISLFNFGISHEAIDAEEYFVSDKIEIRKLYGRKFIAPARMTVFYLSEEDKVAVYNPHGMSDCRPAICGVSELDISSCEVSPLSQHMIDLKYDVQSKLWISEEIDDCDFPYAIGMETTDHSGIHFSIVKQESIDYSGSWKGYFLPRIEGEQVTGAILARGWRPEIEDALKSSMDDNLVCDADYMSRLLDLLKDIEIADADHKKEFIQLIGSMLTTRLLNGVSNNVAFGYFKDVFKSFSGEVAVFINSVPANGRLSSLDEYFAWALILLSVYNDRVGIKNSRFNEYMRFRRVLIYFRPNPMLTSRHYSGLNVCKGIIHAILDGVDENVTQQIVSRGVALADKLLKSLI